jgi:hypothetical protein
MLLVRIRLRARARLRPETPILATRFREEPVYIDEEYRAYRRLIAPQTRETQPPVVANPHGKPQSLSDRSVQ